MARRTPQLRLCDARRFALALRRRCALALVVSLSLTASASNTRADSLAAPLYPYELAYIEAPVIVEGDVVSYDPAQGAMLRVETVARGDVQAQQTYRLGGSANYSFLAATPDTVTAFISQQSARTLELWRGPPVAG